VFRRVLNYTREIPLPKYDDAPAPPAAGGPGTVSGR
jgi:hypothetical protein